MLQCLYLVLVCIVLAGVPAGVADAHLSGSSSRTVMSASGEYLLVLLKPKSDRISRADLDSLEEANERSELLAEIELEEYYSQSGLYKNDGSTGCLWPMPYLSVTKEIAVSDDGIHVVSAFLVWDNPSISDRGNALEFYARGDLLATYNEQDLLSCYAFRLIASNLGFTDWPTCSDVILDDQERVFQVHTNWRDEYIFDIQSGKLVEEATSPVVKGVQFIFYAGILCSVVFVLMWVRRFRKTAG